jgi:WD40 repeat protein
VADQLEELFTIERIFPQVREAFVAALAALARSGLVWVIGTLRADFFPYLEHLPSLAELSASGRYLLLPPNLAELGEIATRPARAAGLHFEVNAAGISLDSVIIAAASRDQGGLPLLSFTLDALWRQPRTGTTLTFDGYERLGGLEGAIATHAERVVSALPEAALAALPGVLLGLVTIREADQSPTGRAANLADLAGNPSAKMLVERLIEARLLVADETEQGITVRLTHEALLRSWPRLAGLIEGSRESLASIARLRTAAAEWERHGRSADLLLPRGKRLSEGVELLEGQLHAINDKLAGFIRESAASARAARRRRRFLITGAFAALCVLTVSAGLGAWFGLSGRLAAEASRNAFREQFEIAERSRAQILALALVNEADPGVIEAVSLSVLASQPDLRRHDEQGSGLLDRLIVAANAKRQRMVLAGHGNQAVSAAFSRDGTRIVTGSFDRKIRIWSASTGALLLTLSGHADQVESAVYSPDGTRIVSASDDRTARIWDATSGAPLLTLSGHGGIVNSANFSPDGRRIVTASDDKTARVWDASTGGLLTTLTGHGAGVSFASFSPDGKTIVTASNDKTARLWDAATGVTLKTLSGHGNFVMAAAFSPDGARIVTACYDKMARVWDSASGALLTTLAGHNGGITFAVFSPDGRRIATASADKTARIWDSDTGALLETLVGHKHVVTSVAFSPDGRLLASASFDNTARIWDVAGTSRFLALSGHQAPISKVRFSPDGRRIATASADKTAKIWDGASGKELGTLIGHDDAVFGLGFSPDGQRLVTGSVDMSVRIWNAESATLQKILAQGGAVVTSTAFSPDGRFVATTSMDKRARILDAATGAPVTVFIGHTGMLRSASFSPDQRRIVTASLDNTARVWDTATGATLLTLSGHGADVTDARFSPDGRLIVTASADKTARIWDAATGRMLHILTGHEDSLRSAAFSPDGKQIVTASLDGSTRVWDAASGAPLARFSAQGAAVRDAAFSPDGRRIATASDDKLARVWDAADLLDTHDLPFIRATSSRGLDSALRAQYALGPAPKAEHFPSFPACAKDDAGVAAWTAGANAGDGFCQARLATLLEGTDLAKDFFRHALAARLLEAQGFEEAAQQERYRREALAWSLPRPRVAELMQAADAWHPGPSPNPLPR